MSSHAAFSLLFRCKQDHEQKLDFGSGFSEDMVHDFGVLIAGGTLRSLGKHVPGFPCVTCGQPVGFSMVDRREARQAFLDAEAARPDRDQPVVLDAPPVDCSATTTVRGTPVGEHLKLEPSGMQRDYVVLTEAERAKGFVRTVRHSYKHVGRPPPEFPLRDLTDDERARYGDEYAKFEEYPEDKKPSLGRFWTQREIDAVDEGCGTVTTMGRAIAETYARAPGFYGSTFCCGCGKHLPVGRDGEFVWEGTDQRVGT